MLRALLTIAGKDLRLRARDRTVYMVGIGAPLGLALILHLTVGGPVSGDISVEVAVVDEDRGQVSEQIVAALDEVEEIDVEVAPGLDADAAEDRVDDGSMTAAMVIPEGFSAAVAGPAGAADEPEIRVIGDVDETIGSQVAASLANSVADQVNAGRLSAMTALTDLQAGEAGDEVGRLVEDAIAGTPPISVERLPADNRELDGSTYLMAGMSSLFLFFTVQIGVTGLLEEQRIGTLARLKAAPIPRLAIPLAKAATSVVLGLGSLVTLVAASTVLMGANWGDPAAVAVLSVAVVLAAVAIMGVVAAVARTPEQAGSYQAMTALVLGIMGGTFFPISQGGEWLARVANLSPHHWFLRGLGEGRAGGLVAALPAVGVLLTFAVVVGGVGALALARRSR